ncbi:bacteriohemerythrin [Desulfobotulus sp. H1]|uniref:Bacteriohemerythrin n=1 Tax=Desulfobotulus pelophilus TaxID=2823377 RepID=A0ABT3N6C3_9BACT|nr:bacteriohemerythrin [Desulfobotulus pelophilus]MCW7753009.1 bacteriohemerythrin [Desulfobotulus pelophilus]
MAYWSWVPGLEIHIPEIDAQHRQIVDYINILATAVEEGNTAKTSVVLEKLIQYTVTHFRFEEKLMKEAGYELFREHCLLHESFKEQVLRYQKRLDEGEDVAHDLLTMLSRWLVAHIKNEDKAFAPIVIPHLDKGWVKRKLAQFFPGR